MSLIGLARRDYKQHLTSLCGAGEDITLSTPDRSTQVNTRGIAMTHHLAFDVETNMPVNSKQSHITLDEDSLNELSYPVRNSKNVVALTGHKVSFPDNNGVVNYYVIKHTFPDETLGVIVCILSDYE